MPEQFKRYKDIDISFRKHPTTRDISPLYDADSIKRSIKLLVLTNNYERPFHPEIGSSVSYHLFENFGPFSKINLIRSIEEVIKNFEPRVTIINVNVDDTNISEHFLEITIIFLINNTKDPVIISFNLERIR